MQLAAFGLFVFAIDSFAPEEITRDRSWAHARNPRVGTRDASQYMGPGDDRLTLPGLIAPGVAGSFSSIDTLGQMADDGEARDFVGGDGRVWGRYVIARIGEARRYLMPDGTPRIVDFVLELDRVE